MKENLEIRKGANVTKGEITFKGVADAFGLKLSPIDKFIYPVSYSLKKECHSRIQGVGFVLTLTPIFAHGLTVKSI